MPLKDFYVSILSHVFLPKFVSMSSPGVLCPAAEGLLLSLLPLAFDDVFKAAIAFDELAALLNELAALLTELAALLNELAALLNELSALLNELAALLNELNDLFSCSSLCNLTPVCTEECLSYAFCLDQVDIGIFGTGGGWWEKGYGSKGTRL